MTAHSNNNLSIRLHRDNEEGAASAAVQLDRRSVQRCFDRGVDWVLKNVDGLSPDARMAVTAALLLVDSERARSAKCLLRIEREVRLSRAGKLLDSMSWGALHWYLRRKRNRSAPIFAVIERDPIPVARTDLDSIRYVPDSLPESLEDLHQIDGRNSNAALVQASLGRLKEPYLSWLRREDLWGYNLSHQLLAWIVCLKVGHRSSEAWERAGRLTWRLFHEVNHGPLSIHYDLFAERVTFLLLAGFPSERLAQQLGYVIASQDAEDGGWWFARSRADHAILIERAYQGSSPMVRPSKAIQPDPELTRRLDLLHRGHSSALSLWSLGFLLRSDGPSPTQR